MSAFALRRPLVQAAQEPYLAGIPFQWRISCDDDLAERVRVDLSAIPTQRPIEVQATGGRVSLRGVVRRAEHDAVLTTARIVDGVRYVEDLLKCEEHPK